MKTRRLGQTGLRISAIGFGAWSAGGAVGTGATATGWSGQSDADSIAAIHRALELGWNWIDTAPVYGLGHSEKVVARALDGLSERPYIFSKCGFRWDGAGRITQTLSPTSIRREVEESLHRLRLEAIDLYQIHWPVPDEQIEAGWATLADLRTERKVRHIGVSNFSVEQLRRCQAVAPVESLQPPYSLLDRAVEAELLPFCAREGIGVLVWGPLAHGLLTGTWTRERLEALTADDVRRENSPHFQEPALTRNLGLVDHLRPLATRLGCSLAELAIAWILRQPAVSGAIVGLRRPEQVERVARAVEFPELAEADLDEIEALLAAA